VTLRRLVLGCAVAVVFAGGACSSETHPRVTRAYGTTTSTELTLNIDSCHQHPKVDADESASEIRLTVTADADNSDDCGDIARVTLDDPVGERSIIDTATGEPLDLVTPAEVE
jgi:hypothetical protein